MYGSTVIYSDNVCQKNTTMCPFFQSRGANGGGDALVVLAIIGCFWACASCAICCSKGGRRGKRTADGGMIIEVTEEESGVEYVID